MEKVIDTFIQLRNIYSLFGDIWRVKAYNNAISCLLESNDINCLKKKLKEKALIIQNSNNELPELIKLKKYQELIKIPGFGTKIIKQYIKDDINPDNIPTKKLTRTQKIGLKYWKKMQKRIPRKNIKQIVKKIQNSFPDGLIEKFKVVGSYRRKQKDSGDIDILIISKTNSLLNYIAKNNNDYVDYLSYGQKKISFLHKWSKYIAQVDIRIINEQSWSTALLYFTGSKMFNVKIRSIAKLKGYKLNEYGLYFEGKRININSEKDIFDKLGIKWLEPHQRSDNVQLKFITE